MVLNPTNDYDLYGLIARHLNQEKRHLFLHRVDGDLILKVNNVCLMGTRLKIKAEGRWLDYLPSDVLFNSLPDDHYSKKKVKARREVKVTSKASPKRGKESTSSTSKKPRKKTQSTAVTS